MLLTRSPQKGRCALQTRVGLALSESAHAAKAMIDDFMLLPETILASDSTAMLGR